MEIKLNRTYTSHWDNLEYPIYRFTDGSYLCIAYSNNHGNYYLNRYTEEEFVDAIRNGTIGVLSKTIQELWDKNYSWMIVRNIVTSDLICINRNHRDEPFRDFSNGCIQYIYMDDKFGDDTPAEGKKKYNLSHENERRAIWSLVSAKSKR